MKKRVILILMLITFVLGILLLIVTKNTRLYIEIDGVKYAILVNGQSSSSFPEGNYKVDAECTNADAYWNSVYNKLILKNIKGDVICDIEFNDIASNDYLNNYLISKSDMMEGYGKIIQEITYLPNFTNSSIVTNYGTTPEFFRNTIYTSTNQTEVNSFWTFNGSTGVFTSDPSKMTTSGSSAYYHVYAQVPSAGYYRICYTIDSSPSANNKLYVSVNGNSKFNISSLVGDIINETCSDIGYISSSDYINVSELGYSDISSPIMTFRMELTTDTDSIDTGYRYEGANPNNYVMFNNELWRIIGIFETEYDTNNDGVVDNTDNLIKIIRKNSIGAIGWDKNNTNDWPNSTIYKLLNEQYFDWETNKNNVSNNCFSFADYRGVIEGKCDYSVNGIQSGFRDMIVKSKWHLGGGGKKTYTLRAPAYVYSYERNGNTVYLGHSTNYLGYIGLMYNSDYLYAVLASDCDRLTEGSLYNKEECLTNNWLFNGEEWTITPYSNYDYSVGGIANVGSLNSYGVRNGYTFRPTLFLSPDVYRVSGTGTITDPYIIGMAS